MNAFLSGCCKIKWNYFMREELKGGLVVEHTAKTNVLKFQFSVML